MGRNVSRSVCLTLTAIICSLATLAATGREPLEVKGDRLGMSLDDFKQKYHRDLGKGDRPAPFCSDAQPGQDIDTVLAEKWHSAAGVVTCSTHYPFEWISGGPGPTLAGQRTELFIYHFVDGSLYRVTVLFSRDGYSNVREALVAKYGEPDKRRQDTLQNAMGAKFTSEAITWSDASGAMELTERFGKVDRSAFFLTDPSRESLVKARAPKPRVDDI